ncbi:MAG: lactate utilization protein [Clostridia bacterium]|nr:lactate utilization protein [Clostridia bacterium]
MTEQISKLFKNLEKNKMHPIFAETKEDAKQIVKDMLFDGCVITSGGSMSLVECGIKELLEDKRYNFMDRSRPGITPEEQQECFKASIGADFFFCSTNAVTEKGELLNVDGFANRISSIAFGPKKVVMIVGVNKIVPDLKAAFLRVKKVAAPKNCVRLNIDNPCAKLGHCVSLLNNPNPDFADGCQKDTRICCDYLVSALQRQKDRITVILVNEELGY